MADYVYYDVVSTGTSDTEFTFFSHDVTDGVLVTNLTEKNKLDRDFELRRLELIPAADISVTDAQKLMEKAIIEIEVNEQTLIRFPAALALTSAGIHFYTEPGNSGTEEYVRIDSTLDGYQFDEPIRIPANTPFKVILKINSAFGTDTNLTIAMHGRV